MNFSFNKIILLMVLLSGFSHSYAQDLRARVVQQFAANKNAEVIVVTDENLTKENPEELLKILNNYKNDGSKNIRFLTFNMGFVVGQEATAPLLRKRAVDLISEGVKDSEALIWQTAAKYLSHFEGNDFNNIARSNIDLALQQKPADYLLIRLAGVAQLNSYKSAFQTIAGDRRTYEQEGVGMWYGKASWAAQLALARMGDATATDYVVGRVESVQNPVLRVTRLLKDIAFTRSKKGTAVLVKYLNDTSTLPSPKEGRTGTPYQQYALDLLAQTIEGFPVPHKGMGYSQDEVTTAINWFNDNPNYKIKK